MLSHQEQNGSLPWLLMRSASVLGVDRNNQYQYADRGLKVLSRLARQG